MHELGLEEAPDVDLQVYSPKIDRAMLEHPELARLAHRSQDRDMWKRWPSAGVQINFRHLDRVRGILRKNNVHVDLEFLKGTEGHKRITERKDWWTLKRPA